mmetsp:Transcript_26860/g.83097  ORF Transcript_26860/g.83097 Transcript_26860/m.83097 type:complete len:341 (-) Transcript_26860:2373-3395(-)
MAHGGSHQIPNSSYFIHRLHPSLFLFVLLLFCVFFLFCLKGTACTVGGGTLRFPHPPLLCGLSFAARHHDSGATVPGGLSPERTSSSASGRSDTASPPRGVCTGDGGSASGCRTVPVPSAFVAVTTRMGDNCPDTDMSAILIDVTMLPPAWCSAMRLLPSRSGSGMFRMRWSSTSSRKTGCFPLPLSSTSPRAMVPNSPPMAFRLTSESWMSPHCALLVIRDARLTVSPKMSYKNFVDPSTPAVTFPVWIPTRTRMSLPVCMLYVFVIVTMSRARMHRRRTWSRTGSGHPETMRNGVVLIFSTLWWTHRESISHRNSFMSATMSPVDLPRMPSSGRSPSV